MNAFQAVYTGHWHFIVEIMKGILVSAYNITITVYRNCSITPITAATFYLFSSSYNNMHMPISGTKAPPDRVDIPHHLIPRLNERKVCLYINTHGQGSLIKGPGEPSFPRAG